MFFFHMVITIVINVYSVFFLMVITIVINVYTI